MSLQKKNKKKERLITDPLRFQEQIVLDLLQKQYEMLNQV